MTPDEMKRLSLLVWRATAILRIVDVRDSTLAADLDLLAAALRAEADARGRPAPQHLYRGWCPDETTGADTRDPHCPACQRMALPPGPEADEEEQRDRGEEAK